MTLNFTACVPVPFAGEQDLAARLSLAARTIYRVDQRTPVDRLELADASCVTLKREDQSHVRSYKWRGAFFKLSQCVEAGDRGPFVATSAGNHAQGVALAAANLGVNATVFMPRTTPILKQQSVAQIGGEFVDVLLAGDTYDEAAATANRWSSEHGATAIAPFDDFDVIAGQATIALELLDQVPRASVIFVPIGGGGLAAGIAFAMRKHPIRVIGVEATGQAAMAGSLSNNRLTELENVDRFCDGTAVARPGQITFAVCRSYLDGIVTVSNAKVCEAIEACWSHLRLIPEPSGALAIAGWMQTTRQGLLSATGKADATEGTCVAIVSGGNTDFLNLPNLVQGSRMSANSRRFFRFRIREQNGALVHLLDNQIGDFNIVDFQYGKTHESFASPVLGLSGTPEQFAALQQRLEQDHCTYEEVTQRETTTFRLIPFHSDLICHPTFLHVDFPERVGALRDMMHEVSGFAGICYFNYAESGTQEGQALIGFECDDRPRLLLAIAELRYPYHKVEMGKLLAHPTAPS